MSVHYVNPEPFDPAETERLTPEQERFYTASQWRLMWWRFRRHRIAVVSAWLLALMYGSILISEWIAPYDLHTRHPDFIHFPHQVEAWGSPSEEIRPYTDLGLDRILASPEGADLRQIVDPFSYRAKLTQPKLVILATNDEYFPLDSANLYYDGLREPKYLLYLPNEPHSVSGYGPVVRGVRALHEAAGGGDPLPQVEWEHRAGDGTLMLCVRTEPEARRVRLWRAVSADRDLRDAPWQPVAESPGSPVRFVLPEPAQGYVAFFGEAGFGARRRAFALSTSLDPRAGRYETPGAPFRMRQGWVLRRPAPLLDEHAAEIRAELAAAPARPRPAPRPAGRAAEPAARRVRLWRALSADRDLRDAQWQAVAESPRSPVRFVLPEPEQGYVAIVGEAEFGARRRAFALSTSLAVAAAAGEPPYGTVPTGREGLCEALESTPVVKVPP
jgi:hypothetical protein